MPDFASNTSTTATQTLEQRRAAHAWAAVDNLSPLDAKTRNNIRTEAKKLPARARSAGLGQALAFIRAKGIKKRGLDGLDSNISDWVCGERGGPLAAESPVENQRLLESILEKDAAFLRLATHETVLYLEWFNRFIEAKWTDLKDMPDSE